VRYGVTSKDYIAISIYITTSIPITGCFFKYSKYTVFAETETCLRDILFFMSGAKHKQIIKISKD